MTGADYEYWRGWIKDRIIELSQVFALDVCAYAVMSNHYHIVLHINAKQAKSWSTKDVIDRWHTLFKDTVLTHRYLANTLELEAEREVVEDLAGQWREQLMSISWFIPRGHKFSLERMDCPPSQCRRLMYRPILGGQV